MSRWKSSRMPLSLWLHRIATCILLYNNKPEEQKSLDESISARGNSQGHHLVDSKGSILQHYFFYCLGGWKALLHLPPNASPWHWVLETGVWETGNHGIRKGKKRQHRTTLAYHGILFEKEIGICVLTLITLEALLDTPT